MQKTNETKQNEAKPEYITRTTWSHGTQVIVVERKQQPMRVDGIEI